MEVNFSISNADEKLINAIKSVIKLYPQAKTKVKICKKPSKELLKAVREAESGEVVHCADFDEYKAKINE